MNGYLKQSTASQARLIGPFLDSTDFVTAETGLTIANTDVKLRANGTTLANKNSGGGTHEVNGMYSLTWDATDTANVGELAFSVVVAGALPVFGTYVVLEEAVYDQLFAASATGAVPVASGGITTASFAAGAIDAAAIGTGAIDADAIAADAIGESELATDAITELADAVVAAMATAPVGSVAGDVGGDVTGSVGSLATQAKADVNAEVVDALNTDTYAEPGQGAPAATTTLVAKIGYLYKAWRNKSTQTASQYSLFADDATTVDQKATFADDATTATRGEVATGP